MHIEACLALLAVSAIAAAQSLDEITEVSSCHAHGEVQYCFVAGEDLQVITEVDTDTAPKSYSDCHAHGAEL